MDKIELPGGLPTARRKERFFARAIGTAFDVKAQTEGSAMEIDLYDEIGYFGITAKGFRSRLKEANGGDVKIKMNSPGGDVFDGIAIYNDLLDHPGNVRVEVTGLAASAASIIAMAGDTIAMGENAFMMIHNAWGVSIGDKETHANSALLLTKIDGALAKTYANRTKLGVRQLATMMDNETWLTAKAAIEQGFADEMTTVDNKAKAAFDVSIYENAPAELIAQFTAEHADALEGDEKAFGSIATVRDLERALMHDAGLTRSKARAYLKATRAVLTDTATQDAGDTTLAEFVRAINEATAKIARK